MNERIENAKDRERRRGGRVLCALTTCQYGPVVNISRTGLRVLSRKMVPTMLPGASLTLLINASGRTLSVPARSVHNRPKPDGHFEVGFQFVGVTPEQSRELIELARTAFDCEVMKRRAAG